MLHRGPRPRVPHTMPASLTSHLPLGGTPTVRAALRGLRLPTMDMCGAFGRASNRWNAGSLRGRTADNLGPGREQEARRNPRAGRSISPYQSRLGVATIAADFTCVPTTV